MDMFRITRTLDKCERLNYGQFSFRLTVTSTWLCFSMTSVYFYCPCIVQLDLRGAWLHASNRLPVRSRALILDLDELLKRKLRAYGTLGRAVPVGEL